MSTINPDELDLPDTEQYRVTAVAASFMKPVKAVGADGKWGVILTYASALRGEVVELTSDQATRLEGLNAVKPKDAPLGYEEENEEALAKFAAERGMTVRGTGANGEVLREDLINALIEHDRVVGTAVGASTTPGGVSTTLTGTTTEQRVGTGEYGDLVGWIKSDKPTVDDVIEEADDDPDKARALLAAESEATGGQPRKGVVSGLQEIIDDDDADEE